MIGNQPQLQRFQQWGRANKYFKFFFAIRKEIPAMNKFSFCFIDSQNKNIVP